MTQTTPTVDEATTFCRYLIDHGEKKHLEAFRVTFPRSTATNVSASVAAHKLSLLPDITLRLDELRHLSRQMSNTNYLLDVEYKKRMIKRGIDICGETHDEDGRTRMEDSRSYFTGIDILNRMDGEYAADNAQRHEPLLLVINLAGNPDDR